MSLIVLYFGRLSLFLSFSLSVSCGCCLCAVFDSTREVSPTSVLVSGVLFQWLTRCWAEGEERAGGSMIHESNSRQPDAFWPRFLQLDFYYSCLLAAAARSNYIPAGRLATKDKGTDETERCTTTGPANQRENSASHVTTLSSTLVLSSPSMFPI